MLAANYSGISDYCDGRNGVQSGAILAKI